ncbi:MAG: methyl-accepting chemotaxis protein, partial [Pirellulaceae bacterium]|nr:methyl-accepting chemotaxis protein [Pirellulaceae bacterium]
MQILNRQNASTLFLMTLGCCLSSLVVLGTLAVTTVNQVKVGGDLHSQVIEGKDLIADILPPPAFIIESYQVAGQLLQTKDTADRDAMYAT